MIHIDDPIFHDVFKTHWSGTGDSYTNEECNTQTPYSSSRNSAGLTMLIVFGNTKVNFDRTQITYPLPAHLSVNNNHQQWQQDPFKTATCKRTMSLSFLPKQNLVQVKHRERTGPGYVLATKGWSPHMRDSNMDSSFLGRRSSFPGAA